MFSTMLNPEKKGERKEGLRIKEGRIFKKEGEWESGQESGNIFSVSLHVPVFVLFSPH